MGEKMSVVGFIYVLANSSMPGLVKVGKTTRTPSERAGELAGVTGLPTPFIVVYEQLFQDCDLAEAFVHTYLAEKGHRVAENREFFNAPTNIVVRAIGLAPGAIEVDLTNVKEQRPHDELHRHGADKLNSLNQTKPETVYPWQNSFLQALAHYYGTGESLQDYGDAMKLFRQAATLGAVSAYGYIGRMFQNGEGVRKDETMALEFFKEGSRKGNIYCDWAMGILFLSQSNRQNAEKCFARFLDKKVDLTEQKILPLQLEKAYIIQSCMPHLMDLVEFTKNPMRRAAYISRMTDSKKEIPSFHRFVSENRQNISNQAVNWLKNSANDGHKTVCLNNLIEYLVSPDQSPSEERDETASTMQGQTVSADFGAVQCPSEALAAIVGSTPLPRTEVVSKLWEYIKKNRLQDSVNKRMINTDAKLKEVFGKSQVSMFEMAGLIGKHLK